MEVGPEIVGIGRNNEGKKNMSGLDDIVSRNISIRFQNEVLPPVLLLTYWLYFEVWYSV